jgi:hypothetical protein
MARRHSNKSHLRNRANVLQVRVMSPRIAWFNILGAIGKLTKIACVLAATAAVTWAIWQGIHRVFYQNPDFRLQVIDLNPNPAIDENGLVNVTGLNLTASIFDIQVDDLVAKLKALPEILDVHAERRLPGTLVVRVIPRTPKAWISYPENLLSGERKVGEMLVDQNAVAYPCPKLQIASAANLPMIELSSIAGHPIKAGEAVTSPEIQHCFQLLDAASKADPDALRGIRSVRQINPWSLELITRDGTIATFGVGDHERQMANLRASLDHADERGYSIGTINLIPKYNIPITVKSEHSAPKALTVAEPSSSELSENRRARDLSKLLNRN